MRICFFTDTFFPIVGGAEMVLHNLAVQLEKQGIQICVLAPKIRGKPNRCDCPYPVYRYGHPSSKRLLVRQTLVHLIWLQLSRRFDLLHCHAAYPQAYVGATFKKWLRIPMVVRPHGSDIVPDGRMRRNRRVERRLCLGLNSADAIIAQGQYLFKVIQELGIEEKRIRIIHNGVDLEVFRKSHPFPHNRPYILSVGSLIHRKGFDILLSAYSKLDPSCPDLLIAGSGREKDSLMQLSRKLNLQDRVRFLGRVTGQEKIDLFRSATFFVCPSRKEPFANVILESMAAGLPVVASAVDGNVELVEHQVTGHLFPSENIEALTLSLQHMINNQVYTDGLRSKLSEFIKHFDWRLIAAQYLSLFKELIL
jgi:glycosyltransferase involved in cell wall biosynthesis